MRRLAGAAQAAAAPGCRWDAAAAAAAAPAAACCVSAALRRRPTRALPHARAGSGQQQQPPRPSPALAARPGPSPQPVPPPVAAWAAGGELLRLHARALQQLPGAMASLPCAAISSSVDFGVKQVPSAAQLARLYAAGPGVGQPPPPPLSFFRELRVTNTSAAPLRLLNVCAAPGQASWLGLADDHQVARPAEQLALMLGAAAGAAEAGEAAALQAALAACPCRLLELRPGQEATLMVALDLHSHLAAGGPDAELGILQQLLLFTLLLPAELLPRGAAAAPPPHALVPGTGEVAVVLGRTVTAVLVAQGRAADLQSCLRAEARPFVSAALRGLFDTAPASLSHCQSPLGAIFGGLLWALVVTGWWIARCTPPVACRRLGLPALRAAGSSPA